MFETLRLYFIFLNDRWQYGNDWLSWRVGHDPSVKYQYTSSGYWVPAYRLQFGKTIQLFYSLHMQVWTTMSETSSTEVRLRAETTRQRHYQAMTLQNCLHLWNDWLCIYRFGGSTAFLLSPWMQPSDCCPRLQIVQWYASVLHIITRYTQIYIQVKVRPMQPHAQPLSFLPCTVY